MLHKQFHLYFGFYVHRQVLLWKRLLKERCDSLVNLRSENSGTGGTRSSTTPTFQPKPLLAWPNLSSPNLEKPEEEEEEESLSNGKLIASAESITPRGSACALTILSI